MQAVGSEGPDNSKIVKVSGCPGAARPLEPSTGFPDLPCSQSKPLWNRCQPAPDLSSGVKSGQAHAESAGVWRFAATQERQSRSTASEPSHRFKLSKNFEDNSPRRNKRPILFMNTGIVI